MISSNSKCLKCGQCISQYKFNSNQNLFPRKFRIFKDKDNQVLLISRVTTRQDRILKTNFSTLYRWNHKVNYSSYCKSNCACGYKNTCSNKISVNTKAYCISKGYTAHSAG